MEIFKVLLITHILCGGLSLALGLYILIVKKGTAIHKKVGKAYFYAMLINSVVAIPMSYLHPNYFLFLISIFTIYMLLTGLRYLHKKKLTDVNKYDWFLTIIMLLFSVAFVGFGIFNFTQENYFGIIFMVFGFIGLFFSYQDRLNFTGKSKIKNFFLTTHIQRMTGSYIASTTAFLVVNNTLLPSIMAWLLPTALMAPLIIFWTRKYKIPNKKDA
ncbi:MAG: hypothetical protein JST67_04540 [Bacteroidetes bacterium]|nr:hypothetical protein [Bacteroidota bacterium]